MMCFSVTLLVPSLQKRRPSSLDSRSPKVLRSCSQGVDDDDGHAAHRRLRGSSRLSPDVRLPRGGGAGRRGLWRGLPYRLSRGGRPTVGSPLMRRELGIRRERDGRRERGRGVQQRGMGQHQRPREDMEERNEEDNSMGEGADNQRGGLLDKENRPQGLGADDDKIVEMDQDGTEEEKMDEDGEEGSQLDSDPNSQLLLVSDLNDDLLKSSRLTVTLQRPPKAKRDPGAIVPKLEAAVSTRGSNGQGYVQRKSLQRPRLNNGNAASVRGRISSRSGSSGRHPHVHLRRSSLSHLGQRKGLSLEARATPPHAQAASDSASPSTSSSEALASPVSPPSILSTVKDSGHEPGCEKEVWVSVFHYLTRAELCVCMTVCKSWYKW